MGLQSTTMANPVIAFTGAFGSGCTTSAKFLRDDRAFRLVSLSEVLKSEWRKQHGEQAWQRVDLQRLGDELRKTEGTGCVVDRALAGVDHGGLLAVKYNRKTPHPRRFSSDEGG